jgi:hypothetical protein
VKNPYTDQYGLSFDQQLGSDYAIGAQLMYKHTDDMIGWQFEDDGECLPFRDDPDRGRGRADPAVRDHRRADPAQGQQSGPGLWRQTRATTSTTRVPS